MDGHAMRIPLVLLATLAIAGCVSPGETVTPAATPGDEAALPTPAEPPAAAPTSAAAGSLVVLVRMPDTTALQGAIVTVANDTRLTGDDGIARFTNLTPGTHPIEVKKEAHRTAQLAVEIHAGEEARTEAVLPALEGDKHSHENGLFAHKDHYTFDGKFDCSATYVIITGDCFLLLDNASEQAGLPARPGDATEERNIIDFPLDLTWTSLVVEMTWTTTAPTPATGEGMTLAIEPAEAPADGHAAKYARTSGTSPLRLQLDSGVRHESATAEDMPNALGGEVLRARAYVMGAAHKPADTDLLGVGAAHGQSFKLYVTIFYGETAADGYSAVGGA